MKIKLSTAGLVFGVMLLPAISFAADSKQSTTESVKENVGDAVITTKIKAEFAKDKQVDAMHINVDTDNKGVVTLRGVAKNKAEADKAVTIAKGVQGVTEVKNQMQVASATSTSDGTTKKTESQSMGKHGSEQPLDDTGITTRVKARMATDKLVDAGNISVTTVNGVVDLSGTAKSKAEADKAVSIARQVPHVKSVKNNIQVSGSPSSSGMGKTSSATPAKHSDQPIDDTVITASVKAKMATDKTVSATTVSVKTVNGVVELSGTAKSKTEADQAVTIARGVDHVKSVKNNIQVQ